MIFFLAFYRIVYPLVFELFLEAMTLFQYVGIVMVYNVATIWPFPIYNVSVWKIKYIQ